MKAKKRTTPTRFKVVDNNGTRKVAVYLNYVEVTNLEMSLKWSSREPIDPTVRAVDTFVALSFRKMVLKRLYHKLFKDNSIYLKCATKPVRLVFEIDEGWLVSHYVSNGIEGFHQFMCGVVPPSERF